MGNNLNVHPKKSYHILSSHTVVYFVAVMKNDIDLYELTWEEQIEEQVIG